MKSLAELNQERIEKIKLIFEHYLGMYIGNDENIIDKKLIEQLFRQLNEIE